MKLINLNTWGGRISEPLVVFIKKEALDTDVFCFQEVLKGGSGKTDREEMKDCYERISDILSDYVGYFSQYGEGGYYGESSKGLDFDYGVAVFVKQNLEQVFVDGVTLYDSETKWEDHDGRFAAGAALAVVVSGCVIVNVHGLWHENANKKDTEARLEQSKRIMNLANQNNGKKIICGDFNLLPDTESLKMIEKIPTKNLIKEYDITSTRSSFYKKETGFADYVFVSPEVKVKDFKVLQDEVSDHLPLFLEFE